MTKMQALVEKTMKFPFNQRLLAIRVNHGEDVRDYRHLVRKVIDGGFQDPGIRRSQKGTELCPFCSLGARAEP